MIDICLSDFHINLPQLWNMLAYALSPSAFGHAVYRGSLVFLLLSIGPKSHWGHNSLFRWAEVLYLWMQDVFVLFMEIPGQNKSPTLTKLLYIIYSIPYLVLIFPLAFFHGQALLSVFLFCIFEFVNMRMLWGSYSLLKWSYHTSTHCFFRDKKDRWHIRLQQSNFPGQSNLSAAGDLWMCCLQPHFWLWAYFLPGFPQQLVQVPSCFLLAGVWLDSIVFLKKTPGYRGFITFSDVELVSPSGTVSHQMDLYCRIQQICIFLCTTNLEMILFGDVPVSGTNHMFKPTFVWVTAAQPQERRLYFFSIPWANEVFFF